MMDERTQGAMMLAVGGVALRLGLTDAALSYVKSGLRPLLIASGIVLAVLGAVAVWRAFKEQPAAPPGTPTAGHAEAEDSLLEHVGEEHAHAAVGDDDDGHGHGVSGPKVAWMLALPLLAVLLVAPPPLGAFAAGRQSGNVLSTSQTSYPPLPEAVDGAIPLTMVDYTFRALYDQDESLAGERVRLVGFVTPNEGGDGYLLTRFRLNCCAADGTPVSVEVRGDDLPRTPDTWLALEGTWEPREEALDDAPPSPLSGELPIILAEHAEQVPQPDQPYEY